MRRSLVQPMTVLALLLLALVAAYAITALAIWLTWRRNSQVSSPDHLSDDA